MREVVVTGLGACCALGTDLNTIVHRWNEGSTGVVRPSDEMACLPISGVAPCDVDVRPLLKRRKDRKLLPRAAHLAIVAAHEAYGEERSVSTGLFMGVGREPPEVDTEMALVVSMTDGQLDVTKLYEQGISVYPPLAPLKTLPNLVLAHVAIQLECMGEGGTRTGGAASGLAAIASGFRAVSEGRCDVVLAGASDSLVDPGSARDAVRTGLVLHGEAPGEAAAFFRLEYGRRARSRGAHIYGVIKDVELRTEEANNWMSPMGSQVGVCGVAGASLWLSVQMRLGHSGVLKVGELSGATTTVSWTGLEP